MLTKLLKYEFRSIGRQLIPLYLGVLGLAVVNHFFWFADISRGPSESIPAVATMIAYVAVLVALAVITLLLVIQRFYKGLLTEEGYLMFTLPCKTWQLIAAKGIVASVMMVGGSIVGLLSIMLMGMQMSDWGAFFHGFTGIPWNELFRAHALWPLYVVEFLVLMVVGLFGSIGHIYASIAIGHLFNRHRVAFSIAAYIGINIAQSVIMYAIVTMTDKFGLFSWMDRINLTTANAPWAAHLVMLFMIVGTAIPAAVFFFGTNWILSRKLNLE